MSFPLSPLTWLSHAECCVSRIVWVWSGQIVPSAKCQHLYKWRNLQRDYPLSSNATKKDQSMQMVWLWAVSWPLSRPTTPALATFLADCCCSLRCRQFTIYQPTFHPPISSKPSPLPAKVNAHGGLACSAFNRPFGNGSFISNYFGWG